MHQINSDVGTTSDRFGWNNNNFIYSDSHNFSTAEERNLYKYYPKNTNEHYNCTYRLQRIHPYVGYREYAGFLKYQLVPKDFFRRIVIAVWLAANNFNDDNDDDDDDNDNKIEIKKINSRFCKLIHTEKRSLDQAFNSEIKLILETLMNWKALFQSQHIIH